MGRGTWRGGAVIRAGAVRVPRVAPRCQGGARGGLAQLSGFDRLGILGSMERAGFRVELEREDDGRWIADVVDVPGVMAYGDTREDALDRAAALLIRVFGELDPAGRVQLRRLLAA